MSTSELVLNIRFYPEKIIEQAIEDFKEDALIEKRYEAGKAILNFSITDNDLREQFTNHCLALYKNGIE